MSREDDSPISPSDEWREAEKRPVVVDFQGPYFDTETVETLEGDFEVDSDYLEEHGGYVIISGVEGEVYPCALDVFMKTYRPPESGTQTTFENRGIRK